jgi:hypothetical protein
MFKSAIIDTAIGIIFAYLLLSLTCSAVGEAIESIMRNRAMDLERGIKELVSNERTLKGFKFFGPTSAVASGWGVRWVHEEFSVR